MTPEAEIKSFHNFPLSIVSRLVKYNDLNHHGTLFSGQGAKWFVESYLRCFFNRTRKYCLCKSSWYGFPKTGSKKDPHFL